MSELQGTPEWRAARLGKLTASRIADATARIKVGYGASRANLLASLLVERLTGVPQDTFTTPAMEWGTATEPQARAAYAFLHDIEVVEVGFIPHPTIAMSGGSPDGFLGPDGLIEIKCMNTANHLEMLLGGSISLQHLKQMQFNMACSGRRYCKYVLFDPRLPEPMRMDVRHVVRDGEMIAMLEKEAAIFLAELDAKVAALTEKYLKAAA